MAEQTVRNLGVVDHWEETYNTAVDRMVDECYAPDCEVIDMCSGSALTGREKLRAFEHKVLKRVPGRSLKVLKKFASGDSVAVEAESLFGAQTLKACIILTFNDEGLIISDHTYVHMPAAPKS